MHDKNKNSAIKGTSGQDREERARSARAHYALRCWMRGYPELFSTRAQVDCFIVIGMLTTHSPVIPALNCLYRSLACAENSVRNHLRSLAAGGWIRFVRVGGDRRSIGVRIEPPLIQVFEEYFSFLDTFPPASLPGPDTLFDANPEERAIPASVAGRISA